MRATLTLVKLSAVWNACSAGPSRTIQLAFIETLALGALVLLLVAASASAQTAAPALLTLFQGGGAIPVKRVE